MLCRSLMNTPEVCHEWETVQVAARKMADHNIGFLPISDDRGRLVGTITDRDIAVRVAADDRTASETRISDVMSRDAVTCGPLDTVEEAERIMEENRKSRIVVVGAEGIVGVISIADLAQIGDSRAVHAVRALARPRYHNGA